MSMFNWHTSNDLLNIFFNAEVTNLLKLLEWKTIYFWKGETDVFFIFSFNDRKTAWYWPELNICQVI